MGKSFVDGQRRIRIMLMTVLVIWSQFFIWIAWADISKNLSNPTATQSGTDGGSSLESAVGTTLNVFQPPARTVALASATPADMLEAFVYSTIAPFPDSDLIYVQRGYDKTDEANLIDHTGKWVAAVDYYNPIFSGDPEDDLFPASRNNEWGYINGRGAWAIAPQFSQPSLFKNGVALVRRKDGASAYIDTAGKPITDFEPASTLIVTKDWMVTHDTWRVRDAGGTWKKTVHTYSAFAPFNEHLIIGTREGKMMLVDRNGNPANAQRYEQILSVRNGKAPARQGGKWGVIDEKGDWIVAPQYEASYVDETGVYRVALQGKAMLLDSNGKPVTEGDFRPIAKASEGLTAACSGLRCGYVDQAGKWVIAPQFEQAFSFAEGYARVIKNGLLAYIDHKGRMLTPEPPENAAAPRLWRPDTFGERYVSVSGYIDRNGKYLLPPFYNHLGEFSENLAPVQAVNGKFGYIDLRGNWVIPPVFGETGNFSEGWAMVGVSSMLTASRVYIDAQGREQLTLPNEFRSASEFKNGQAMVVDYRDQKLFIDKTGHISKGGASIAKQAANTPGLQRLSINGGKWGYADAEDHFVIAPKFDDVNDFYEKYASVKIGDQWGYINRSGNIIIQPAYEEVGQFSEGLARVKKNGRWTYIDEKGHAITEENFAVAGDFHDGRAKVEPGLEAVHRLAVKGAEGEGREISASGLFMPNWPVMLSDGEDMNQGIAAIKLAPGGYQNGRFDYYWFALMNKQGELVIPPKRPRR